MHLLAPHLAALIVALDGESVTTGNTGLAVISLVSIVTGWVLIAALWYFVFRKKAPLRKDDPGD